MSKNSHITEIAWVDVVHQNDASGNLKLAYDAVKGRDGTVENLYLAMSQTPEVIKPAEDHYVAILHNPNSPLKPWFAELISTFVAILCGCEYAYLNHGENFEYYFDDRKKSEDILLSLHDGSWKAKLVSVSHTLVPTLQFSKKLTLEPEKMTKNDLIELRGVGLDDKEISYIIQIVSSFAYWSRMINALGTKVGKTIGFSNTKDI